MVILRVIQKNGPDVVVGDPKVLPKNEIMVFYASFMHIVEAILGQADARDNEAKLMTKLAPEWVGTTDPVIRSPARYRCLRRPPSIAKKVIGQVLRN